MLPLSRYCSQRCGILVAAGRIAKAKASKLPGGSSQSSKVVAERLLGRVVQGATKREGLCTWTAEGPAAEAWARRFVGAAPAVVVAEDNEVPPTSGEAEALALVRVRIATLEAQKRTANLALTRLDARAKLLVLCNERLADLPRLIAEEGAAPQKNAGGKRRRRGPAEGEGEESAKLGLQRCGYDERLHWPDAKFAEWADGAGRAALEGQAPLDGALLGPGDETDQATQPAVCGSAKRKCRRHADWSMVRDADFEVERELLVSGMHDVFARFICSRCSAHRPRNCKRSTIV